MSEEKNKKHFEELIGKMPLIPWDLSTTEHESRLTNHIKATLKTACPKKEDPTRAVSQTTHGISSKRKEQTQ